ncbi:hypothetical protein F2Q69_00034299 [Brassica cretica]|uniref:Uncharacterized protein n=1 Tax=Brassica cretica TaxID=69181 RepID=A0A8S9SH18_BRACR|nr:hypothetical protein F2Q69_00034299 [Brassica cretica]
MPMSAHGLKPKKVTSSVPTLHKGAMRFTETLNQQEDIRSQGVNTGPKEHESIEEEPPGEILEKDQNKAQDIRQHMFPKEINSEASILPTPTSTTPGSPSLEHKIQKSNGDNISNKWRQNPSQSYTTQKSEPQESEATTVCTIVAKTTPREDQSHEIIPEPIQRRKIKLEPLIFQVRELKEECTAKIKSTPDLMLEGRNNKSTQAVKEPIIHPLAETIWVNLNFTRHIYKISNPGIMHLFPARSVEFISGTEANDHMGDPHKEVTRCLDANVKVKQEVTTRNSLTPDDTPGHAPPTRMPEQSRGAFMSFPLKEEPPDVPSKIKPIKYQGKVQESQKRMKPDLLYLGSDYPILRSKLFQGRGYDVAIKSVAEPEANQLHQSANQRTIKDMCSVKMVYLTNWKSRTLGIIFKATRTRKV